MKMGIKRQLKTLDFTYVLVILILIVIWISTVNSWSLGYYFNVGKAGLDWKDSIQLDERLSLEFPDPLLSKRDSFDVFLTLQRYDIASEDALFLLTVLGPTELPTDFTKYKPKIIIKSFATRIEVIPQNPDWIEPEKKDNPIIDSYPVTIPVITYGSYPFDVSPLSMELEVESDYLKFDGTVERDKLPITTVGFFFQDSRYFIRDSNLDIDEGDTLKNRIELSFEMTQRPFATVIFVFFFILVNLLIILTLGIKELSNLLQSIAAIVIGLWAMQNIILPENIPLDQRTLTEQIIINTYLLIGIVVIVWLLRQGVYNYWGKSQSTNKVNRIYRPRKKNIKHRVVPYMPRTQSFQYPLKKGISKTKPTVRTTKGKKHIKK